MAVVEHDGTQSVLIFDINSEPILSRGEILRLKYGGLTLSERQSLLEQLLERNAESWVRGYQDGLNGSFVDLGAHFVDRHAPDIPLRPNLEGRAINGANPRTGALPRAGNLRGNPSSQFADWRTFMAILNEATSRTSRGLSEFNHAMQNGGMAVTGTGGRVIGRGFFPNRRDPSQPTFEPELYNWIVPFDGNSGKPYSAYPTR